MERTTNGMETTRVVVEVDGRWNPATLYDRIQSSGLPIQGVKQKECGRFVLSFGEELPTATLEMLQRDIICFSEDGGASPSDSVPKNGNGAHPPAPKTQRKKRFVVKRTPTHRM